MKIKLLSFLTVLILAWGNAAFASGSPAVDADAEAFVDRVASEVIGVIKNESLSLDQREKELSRLFNAHLDMGWIARFAIGRYWSQMNQDQQTQYLALYPEYLTGTYVPKFKSYSGAEITIKSMKPISDNEFQVTTEVLDLEKKTPIVVEYRIEENENGSFQIKDIVGEGVSMITSQRSDFGSLIGRRGVDVFLGALEKKVNKFRGQ